MVGNPAGNANPQPQIMRLDILIIGQAKIPTVGLFTQGERLQLAGRPIDQQYGDIVVTQRAFQDANNFLSQGAG